MKRRDYLGAVAAAVGASGCATVIGTDPDSTTNGAPLAVAAPALEPGESGTITTTAREPGTLRFSEGPDIGERLVEYGAAEFSPEPDATYTIRPPTWVWDSAGVVSGEVPVDVPDTVTPGRYQYTLELRRGPDGETVTEQVTLVVEE